MLHSIHAVEKTVQLSAREARPFERTNFPLPGGAASARAPTSRGRDLRSEALTPDRRSALRDRGAPSGPTCAARPRPT